MQAKYQFEWHVCICMLSIVMHGLWRFVQEVASGYVAMLFVCVFCPSVCHHFLIVVLTVSA